MSIILARQLIPADFVYFDTFDQWSFQIPKSLTKHPVIPSPEVTDHVQVHNATFSFRGYVSLSAGYIPSVTPARMRLFLDTIGGALCVVTTPFGIFTNVVLTTRQNEINGSMVVDVTGEQVRIASITEVPIPPRTPNPAAAAQQSSAQDVGTGSAASSGASLAAAAVDAGESLVDLLF